MVKKFTVVGEAQPEADPAAMPAGLDAAGAALWRHVTSQYEITDASGVHMLAEACRAADRAARCKRIIDKDGEVVVVRGRAPAAARRAGRSIVRRTNIAEARAFVRAIARPRRPAARVCVNAMPSKRTPLRRDMKPRITPEALHTWRRLQRMTSDDVEYVVLNTRLCNLTGVDWMLMIWPVHARSPTVPANLRHRELQREAYLQAHAVYAALTAADTADREDVAAE